MPQSLSNVVVHLVFSTKNRTPWLTKGIREETFAYLVGILRDIGCVPMRVGGYEDHVHLLFAMVRTRTLAQIVEEVKTGSSHWMKKKGVSGFAWQAGYAAFSISMRAVDAVDVYIRNQEQHHDKASFQDEFRSMVAEAGIEFDERYVWD